MIFFILPSFYRDCVATTRTGSRDESLDKLSWLPTTSELNNSEVFGRNPSMVHRIADLLNREEGMDLEFKGNIPEKQAIAAVLCAFANTSGGDLLIGISDRKPRKVVGLSDSEIIELERKVSSIATTSISPPITPFIRIVNVEGS